MRTLYGLCRRWPRARLILLNFQRAHQQKVSTVKNSKPMHMQRWVRNPRPGAVGGVEDAGDTGDDREGDLGRGGNGGVRHVDLLGTPRRCWQRHRRCRGSLVLPPPRRASVPRRGAASAAAQQEEPLERVHQVLDAALAGFREARHGLLQRHGRHRPLPRGGGLAAPPFLVRLAAGVGELGPHLVAALLGGARRQRARRVVRRHRAHRRSRALLGARIKPPPGRRPRRPLRRHRRLLGRGRPRAVLLDRLAAGAKNRGPPRDLPGGARPEPPRLPPRERGRRVLPRQPILRLRRRRRRHHHGRERAPRSSSASRRRSCHHPSPDQNVRAQRKPGGRKTKAFETPSGG